MRSLAVIVCLLAMSGAGTVLAQAPSKSDNTQSGTVLGMVRDSLVAVPVAFASVRIDGQNRGAITRENGQFLLRLPAGKYKLLFSHVSYGSTSRDINVIAGDTLLLEIDLSPAGVVIPEVVVALEDPGVSMMRRAIARQQMQKDSIENYSYNLYTKFVALSDTNTAGRISVPGRDTVVVAIFESYSNGYYQEPDEYFNEIYQRRQSANVPPQANFVAFGTNLNAYDDYVTILGEEIATPFHPDALDYYDFVFERRLRDDGLGRSVNRIRATPKSNGRRLFDGLVYLDADDFYPTQVDLEPNRAVQLPFDAELSYKQLFEENEGFVMPSGMHIKTHVSAEFLWIFDPRLDIDIETVATDYKFNYDIDEDVFSRRRVELADSADVFDSTYWFDNALVALSEDEERAYAEILTSIENPDSIETRSFFDKYLGSVQNVLRTLNRRPYTGLQDVIQYNSINGLRLGLGMSDFVTDNLELTGKLAYGSNDGRVMGELDANYFLDDLHRFSIRGGLHRKLERRDNPFFVTQNAITPTSFLFGVDYGDYYYSEGYRIGVGIGLGQDKFIRRQVFVKPYLLELYVRQQRQQSAPTGSAFSLFNNSEQRANPSIFGGMLRTLNAELNINYSPLRRVTDLGGRLTVEVSDPSIIDSDFRFERYDGTFFWRTETLPLWRLDLRLSAGFTRGDVPPQRFFSPETAVSSAAVDGAFRTMEVKEFYGDRYVSMNIEHNFGEVVPGILRIPNVASFGIEFIGLANFGWTDFGDQTRKYTATELPTIEGTRRGFFYEVGLGINRILIFFRIDITARMTQTPGPAFNLTFSRASF